MSKDKKPETTEAKQSKPKTNLVVDPSLPDNMVSIVDAVHLRALGEDVGDVPDYRPIKIKVSKLRGLIEKNT